MGSRGTGWVASNYLVVTGGGSATATRTPTRTATTASGFPAGSTVRTTDSVNMRTGPGTSYNVIRVLSANTACSVISGPTSANGYQWYRLNCGSLGTGYVAGNYLTLVSAASIDLPTSTPLPGTPTLAATDAATTAPSETATEVVEVMPPTLETETPVPTEVTVLGPPPASPGIDIPVLETPTEILVSEPQLLPIARIQRSEGSSAGQVLVDGDASTVWTTDGTLIVPLAAFIADLDAPQYVSTVRWQVGGAGISGTMHVSVSTDNVNWTELSIDAIAAPGEWQELTVDSTVQYIRFVFVNDDGLQSVGGIAEIEVWP
jgi:uncharacterized protein YraI